VCGCSRGCKGCSNPELWKRCPEYEIEPKKVFSLIKRIADTNTVDGFTFSGGEPMNQTEDLAALLKLIKPISDDVLIYTGYRFAELQERNDKWTNYILQNTAVLIDGEYKEELNNGSVIRGSSNQQVYILNNKYDDFYLKYLSETHNQIQNFTTANGIVSVGIHHPTF
jgi:anaerobic ribonucleoside-triphosphate reductase activating protein